MEDCLWIYLWWVMSLVQTSSGLYLHKLYAHVGGVKLSTSQFPPNKNLYSAIRILSEQARKGSRNVNFLQSIYGGLQPLYMESINCVKTFLFDLALCGSEWDLGIDVDNSLLSSSWRFESGSLREHVHFSTLMFFFDICNCQLWLSSKCNCRC